jgi:hypothetical protein
MTRRLEEFRLPELAAILNLEGTDYPECAHTTKVAVSRNLTTHGAGSGRPESPSQAVGIAGGGWSAAPSIALGPSALEFPTHSADPGERLGKRP